MPTEAERKNWNTDPDAAYTEALRRVEEARQTDTHRLNLNGDESNDGALRALNRIPPLHDLPNVTHIDFDNTQVIDITPISNLNSLKSLRFNNTQVADITPIANLSALETLRIANTNVIDLSPAANLHTLKTLRIENTQISNLAPISDLNSLETFWLESTQVVNLEPIADLHALETLWLNSSEVKDLSPVRYMNSFNTGAKKFGGLAYADTPATRIDQNLSKLAMLDSEARTRETLLYLNDEHPEYGGGSHTQTDPALQVPDMPIEGAIVISARYDGKRVTIDGSAQGSVELEMLFGILRRETDDLGDYGSLHNAAKLTAIALDRYTSALPDNYTNLDSMGQIRLGVEGKLLGTKYGGERSMLKAEFPEKVGMIDALLVAHDLLVDRLASYQDFLKTTEAEPALTEAQETTIIENVDLIAEEWEKDPDTVDPAIPETLYGLRHAVRDVKAAGHAILRGLSDVVRSVLVWMKTETADIASGTWQELKPRIKKDLARVIRLLILGSLSELAIAIPWFGDRIARGIEFLKTWIGEG